LNTKTWLPGYPFFVFNSPSPLYWEAAAEYLANAVEIPSPTTDRLCQAARAAGIDVVIGIVELDGRTGGTVYCTLLFIGREGTILGRHRKLKPTNAERAMWGEGDALGLVVHQRPYGRLSGLNCWEHQMVLPGYALIAQGNQIHVASWPGREPPAAPQGLVPMWPRQLLLSRAYAAQSAAYVIAVGGMLRQEDLPKRFRELAAWDNTGDSTIIDPRGEVIAGPAEGETILMAKGSAKNVLAAKAACDVGGHYSRPDILRLHVDARPLDRLTGPAGEPAAQAPSEPEDEAPADE
jgi:predicted amidohydrolase